MALVRQAGLSFRGAAAALAVFAASPDTAGAPARMPGATTVRSWVLRLGHAQLTRPLSHDHSWAWLIDHTIQSGSQKLLVIVAVRLDDAPFGVRPLRLVDLSLATMIPMERADQHTVLAALEQTVARTGVPRQIVCDGAPELNTAVARFQTAHPGTILGSDTAHHAAALLKHYWEGDPAWVAFARRMTEAAAGLRPTASAGLLPPKLRNKARFMTVGAFVRFGRRLLDKLREPTPDAAVARWYGWVAEYAAELTAWHDQHALVAATLRLVRTEGLFARLPALLEEAWRELPASGHPTTTRLRNRLRAHVARGCRPAKPGERLIGSTEVLESAFGVQKRLSRDQSAGGLTGLVVGLGAMLGETTPEQITSDLDRVPEKTVRNWIRRTLGRTLQAIRRQFTRSPEPIPG